LPSTFRNTSRTACEIACRFAHAKFADAHIAAKYSFASGDSMGAHASSRSGTLMPYRSMTRSMRRT
jgi:hypothetical protein